MTLGLPFGAAIVLAIALYLVPFVLGLLALGPRARSASAIGVALPALFAADLLAVLVLSWAVRLEWAIVASRVSWLAASAALAARRRLAWPRCLGPRASAVAAGGAGLGAWASLLISHDYAVWDRRWHVPLVTAMQGQRLPFQNVYDPGAGLHYHFSGDVHAAMIRALSFDRMTSSLALSLSHDVVFAAIGATVALLLVERVRPAVALVGFAVAAMLLHGPIVQNDATGFHFSGHMYQLFISVGFRPHLPISGLMTIGLVAAACLRAAEGAPSIAGLAATMLPTAALLGITDETSTAIVAASLGAAWLVDPSLLGGWRRGAALLAAFVAAVVAANLGFEASLAPGSPVQELELVAPRIAELRGATQPLWTPSGLTALAYDVFPFAVPALGVALHAARARSRSSTALAVLAVTATLLSAALATTIRVNGQEGVEAERFFVAVFFVVYTVAFWQAPAMTRGSLAWGLVALGPAASLAFTYWWFRMASPDVLAGSEAYHKRIATNLFKVDCARAAASRMGEPPELTYLDESTAYFYASCRAVFEAGETDPPWPVPVRPAFDESARHMADFSKLAARFAPGATVPAACATHFANDAVCAALRGGAAGVTCTPAGDDFVSCPLTPHVRARFLAPTR